METPVRSVLLLVLVDSEQLYRTVDALDYFGREMNFHCCHNQHRDKSMERDIRDRHAKYFVSCWLHGH